MSPTLKDRFTEEEEPAANPTLNATITIGVTEDGALYLGIYVVVGGIGAGGVVAVYACMRVGCAGRHGDDGAESSVVMTAGGFPLRHAESILNLAGSASG